MKKQRKPVDEPLDFAGVRILSKVPTNGHVFKRPTDRGGWILESASSMAIARFSSEQSLDEWCQAIQEAWHIRLEIANRPRATQAESKTSAPTVFQGVRVPAAVRAATEFVKFKEGRSWVLVTGRGKRVARFRTHDDVDLWWKRFMKSGLAEPTAVLTIRRTARGSEHLQRSTGEELAAAKETRATKDRFARAMSFAFREFHPRVPLEEVSSIEFFEAVASYFPKTFVVNALSSMAASPPSDGETESIAWVHQQFVKYRTNETRSIKDCFELVAATLKAAKAARTAAFGSSFEHRAVGSARQGGRWGS